MWLYISRQALEPKNSDVQVLSEVEQQLVDYLRLQLFGYLSASPVGLAIFSKSPVSYKCSYSSGLINACIAGETYSFHQQRSHKLAGCQINHGKDGRKLPEI